MKFRILSDLHLYINENYPLELQKDDIFTLIAGDIGPDYKKNAIWLRNNIRYGAFISGNHDAYTFDNTPLDDVKNFYHKEFPADEDIVYFDYDVGVITKELDENILLVADVLYTDYNASVYPDDKDKPKSVRITRNKSRAAIKFSGSYMNDFWYTTRKGSYIKSEFELKHDKLPKDIFYLRPDNYELHFKKTFKEITRIIEDNPDKDIILMTHHCLSRKCMSGEYNKESLSASYYSNKEYWIKKHPNIKMIVSGHIHNVKNFKIGKTLYVMNPLGYCRNYEDLKHDFKTGKTELWTPDFIVDSSDWSVSITPSDSVNWRTEEEKKLFN